MKKVAIYCRLARKDFLGIREQKKELVAFAKEQGYSNFKLYIDNGKSGSPFDRPAFSKLNKAIQNGEIDTIIMRDISRVGRGYVQASAWFESVKNLNLTILILGGELEKPALTSSHIPIAKLFGI